MMYFLSPSPLTVSLRAVPYATVGTVVGMGTIPIPTIDTVDTCELGVSINGKYRYFHQVSLVFDTEPALFVVSMYV